MNWGALVIVLLGAALIIIGFAGSQTNILNVLNPNAPTTGQGAKCAAGYEVPCKPGWCPSTVNGVTTCVQGTG